MSPLSDTLVISVIPEVELKALQAVFNIDPLAKADYEDDFGRYWFVDVLTGLGPQRIALTCIGLQGSVHAASFTTNALEMTKPRTAFLVGICAGLREKTALGDVIASTKVIGYEPARLESTGTALQPDHLEPPFALLQDLSFFDAKAASWQGRCTALQQKLNVSFGMAREPRVHSGIIASGEKVLADGSLAILKEKYHEKIRGGEKEGIGFASACRRRRREVPWLVIKGVSDFGGQDKNNQKDEETRQLVAAANAAAFTSCFIEHGLVTSSRSRYFDMLDGERDLFLHFRSIFIDDPGDNGEIYLLALVGGWPKFNPFEAIDSALARQNRVKMILSREALDDWARKERKRAKRLLSNPLLEVRYIKDFNVRYVRIGVNKKKNMGLFALYHKDRGELDVEGFATSDAIVIESITRAFEGIFNNCSSYGMPE